MEIGARTVLVASPDQELGNDWHASLEEFGYSIIRVASVMELLERLSLAGTDLAAAVIDDTLLEGADVALLKQLRSRWPALSLILIVDSCVPARVLEASESGASEFLVKPVSPAELLSAMKHVSPHTHPQERGQASPADIVWGTSHCFSEIAALLRHVGPWDVPVLIEGETGVGKEVFARQIHAHSARAHQPFIKVDCATFPGELIESELFGFERGAFTGAVHSKPGRFELAQHGTILLDEIAEMDIDLQAKLLRVVQDHEFERLGGRTTVHVDVRILAATNRDLKREMRAGRFREDLYYRISAINVRIPPLRERAEDIRRLAEHLIRRHCPPGFPTPSIPPVLERAMLAYSWPGNVRELENFMQKYLILGQPELRARELEERSAEEQFLDTASPQAPASILDRVNLVRQEAEKNAIVGALHSAGWNRRRAAQALGLEYKALLYRMRKLGVEENPVPIDEHQIDPGHLRYEDQACRRSRP